MVSGEICCQSVDHQPPLNSYLHGMLHHGLVHFIGRLIIWIILPIQTELAVSDERSDTRTTPEAWVSTPTASMGPRSCPLLPLPTIQTLRTVTSNLASKHQRAATTPHHATHRASSQTAPPVTGNYTGARDPHSHYSGGVCASGILQVNSEGAMARNEPSCSCDNEGALMARSVASCAE